MKKNLLTLLFVMAFVCGGVSVASAKTPVSSNNSIASSKKVMTAKHSSNKITAICVFGKCDAELAALETANTAYVNACAPQYLWTCRPDLAAAVIAAGKKYETCLDQPLGGPEARNSDKTTDWDRAKKSQLLSNSQMSK